MLATCWNGHLADGNLATTKWNIGSVSITPYAGSKYTWKSKATGLVYHTKYRVKMLRKGSPSGHSADLTMTAFYGNQEVAFKGGRAVYEGLYKVTGWLDGRWVSGQAWGEVQPAGSL